MQKLEQDAIQTENERFKTQIGQLQEQLNKETAAKEMLDEEIVELKEQIEELLQGLKDPDDGDEDLGKLKEDMKQLTADKDHFMK